MSTYVFVQAALIQAHKDFTFVLFGARRPFLQPALAEAREAKELPLVRLNHHGYYHGIILKRLVAGYAGAPFGHAFEVLASGGRGREEEKNKVVEEE